MRIVILGTSSGKPTPRRSLSSTALVRNGELFLFDAGEGTQVQIRRANLRLSRIRIILISHFHGDHINGLPGLLGTLTLDRHCETVKIVGPVGVQDYISTLKRLRIIQPGFAMDIKEISGKSDKVHQGVGFSITACLLKHRIPCYGYAFVEDTRPGRFDIEAARALQIPPGPLYSRLQHGESITLDDQTVIEPSQVLGPARSGRKVVYCTDTSPCYATEELARGADCLIHEGTYGNDMETEAIRRGHSTGAQAARIAKRSGVQRLVLTHISPTYQDIGELVKQARSTFPNTIIARDLETIELPLKE